MSNLGWLCILLLFHSTSCVFFIADRAESFGRLIACMCGYSGTNVFKILQISTSYNNYGCHCGIGAKGTTIVDNIDLCCFRHDLCWERSRKLPNCETKHTFGFDSYTLDCESTVSGAHPNPTFRKDYYYCDYEFFMCDYEFTHCVLSGGKNPFWYMRMGYDWQKADCPD